ncbi:MAG: endo-1,4-beta-xylanase [Planctomycetes bacterium]|nr:endo-1,4-beta-xylanase [Planctomycetota bacterium]
MGVMRFLIPSPDVLAECPDIYRAYISGFDGRIFPTRVEIEETLISCRRQVSDSGNFSLAWPVAGFGQPVLKTASLVERDEPYRLVVELARGKISQVREQLSAWEMQGMRISDDFHRLHRDAHHLFAAAVSSQETPQRADELAQQALQKACLAAELLVSTYTTQRLEFRRRRTAHLPALMGCRFGDAVPAEESAAAFCEAFNAAAIPIEWKHIEPNEGDYHWETNDAQIDWCIENRLFMSGGPLIDLSLDGLPSWLGQWETDFLNLQSFVCDFVETAITRYYGKIRNWEISAHVNTGGALALSEENRLALVAKTLEVARHVDEEIQLMIGIDQPWGDYQARGHHRLSPFQFVDALVRSGVGISGVNLEFGIGYRPRGTATRDLLEFSQLIDFWGHLGIPIYVTLAYPSARETDPQATPDLEVCESGYWKTDWSEAAQANWVEQFLPLLMAKQTIMGIFWTHYSDAVPHDFPNAGLLRPDGSAKPILDRITKYRRTYWTADGDATPPS